MTRPVLLAASLLAALPLAFAAGPAGAESAERAETAAGIALRWNACAGDGGVAHRAFACDGTGPAVVSLVGSFRLERDVANVSGAEIVVDVSAAAEALPAWWRLRDPHGCRASALSIAAADGEHCADWAAGQASMNIAGYRIGEGGANTARLLCVNAVPLSALADLSAGIEYTVMKLNLRTRDTSGPGDCAGCDTPVCLVFRSLHMTTSRNADNRRMTTAMTTGGRVVTWQAGRGPAVCPGDGDGRARTWESVRDTMR